MAGINLYQYAPNPLGWVDPLGSDCEILFGQRRIGPKFQNMSGEVPEYLKGKSIEEIAELLKEGKLHPDQLPINYFIHENQRITENNRSLATLYLAGMKPTIIHEVPATPELIKCLNEKPLKYHGEIFTMPSRAIPVTNGKNDTDEILKIIRIPDEFNKSY